MSLFTKRERSLIFSALKKSSFLKFSDSMILKYLNLFNISMMYYSMIFRRCYYKSSVADGPVADSQKNIKPCLELVL